MVRKFFIIAGEASGDLLGAKLIKELKLELAAKNQIGEFVGVGGKMMQAEGLESIFDIKELSLMGFLEIIPHLPKLIKRINQTAREIVTRKPEFVITIDAPDFNFRVVTKVNKLLPENKFRKIHLIAPSVWAYREKRAQKIAKIYDLLLAILPFEPAYFAKYGLKTVFIGHPITENLPDFNKKAEINAKFRATNQVNLEDIVIVVTPGSRNGEVTRIFPEFINAINLLSKTINNIKVAIPLIDKTEELVTVLAQKLTVDYFLVKKEGKEAAFFAANYALAKSGTNTVEMSLFKLPMVVAYKINPITHFIVKLMVKIKFANLINLILNKEVIKEMLQKDCVGFKLALELEKLILNKDLADLQIAESALGLQILGVGMKKSPSKTAAQQILN